MFTSGYGIAIVAWLLSILGYVGAVEHPSFFPIAGKTDEERQMQAEEQCHEVCRNKQGWSGRFICRERPLLNEYREIYYQVLGCVCECND